MDVAKLKVADLKFELRNRGLSTTGNKHELIERLRQAILTSVGMVLDADMVLDGERNPGIGVEEEEEEEEVEEEEEEEEELSEPSVNNSANLSSEGIPETVLSPPTVTQEENQATDGSLKREGSKDDSKIPSKKIVLNRNTLPAVEKENVEGKEAKDDTESLTDEQQKVVKLSDIKLTPKQRMELRAKKFADDSSTITKAEVRAARFSLQANTPKTTITMDSSVDILKKRAERFGSSVSGIMEQVLPLKQTIKTGSETKCAEMEERKKRRQERFALSDESSAPSKTTVTTNTKIKTPVATPTVTEAEKKPTLSKRVPITAPNNSDSTSSAVAINDKKKMRAERFKIK